MRTEAEIKDYRRSYYLRNREKILERQKAVLRPNPEEYRAHRNKITTKYRRTRNGWAVDKWNNLKTRAAKDGILMNLTAEDLLQAMPLDRMCPVFNRPFVFEGHSPDNASIDKLVPELGYVRGNIRIISRRANTIKQDATVEELLRVAEWVKAELAKAGAK